MDEFDEVLAMEVRRYEHLYNPTMKEHKNQQMAWNSWQEIGQTLDKDPELCRTTWSKLRDRFTKAKSRLKKKSGAAGGKNPVPQLYIQLQWLIPHVKHRATTTNMPANEPMVSKVLHVVINYVVHVITQ